MPTTHQTARLTRGSHSSPEHGVCVMELASMLAGEPFSDHPRSVCPVIGAFLRTYNDRVDDERRQDLYAVAAQVVGTHADADVVEARAQACSAFARRRTTELRRWRRWLHLGSSDRLSGPAAMGVRAVRSIRTITDDSHAQALALIDELVAIGRSETASLAPTPTVPRGAAGAAEAPQSA